jgi:hypothetical protein
VETELYERQPDGGKSILPSHHGKISSRAVLTSRDGLLGGPAGRVISRTARSLRGFDRYRLLLLVLLALSASLVPASSIPIASPNAPQVITAATLAEIVGLVLLYTLRSTGASVVLRSPLVWATQPADSHDIASA